MKSGQGRGMETDLWDEWPLQGFEQTRGMAWTGSRWDNRLLAGSGRRRELSMETLAPVPVNRDGAWARVAAPEVVTCGRIPNVL